MTRHDRDRVETVVEKVEYVETCLEILAGKQAVSRERYRSDPEVRDVVERRFEKATTACLDVGRILLKDIDGRAPESNAATMKRLHDVDVLSGAVADEMAQAALFRNVLAHEYGDVLDHDIVFDALQNLDRYRRFLREVRDYFDRIGAI